MPIKLKNQFDRFKESLSSEMGKKIIVVDDEQGIIFRKEQIID